MSQLGKSTRASEVRHGHCVPEDSELSAFTGRKKPWCNVERGKPHEGFVAMQITSTITFSMDLIDRHM